MIPVILSGGSGTRLWPLSRPHYPKQFLTLHSDVTLFQETIERLDGIALSRPIIVSNDEHRFIVAENLRGIGVSASKIILEPVGRNTAPAIAVAALAALEIENDPILFVLPADHVIQDVKAFGIAAKKAEGLAKAGHLVTFGVKPTEAHTGYGYIEAGEGVSDTAFKIAAFKEKPDAAKAQEFFQSGQYFWNSGMFVFKAAQYLKELEAHEPDMVKAAKASLENAKSDLDFLRLDGEAFGACKNISIDYAVMERTKDGVVIMLDAKWCDVGSWSSLWDVLDKDENGNVKRGDIVSQQSHDNYIYAGHKLVTTLGVNDLVIVDTKDALMIADKSKVEDLKQIVEGLKKAGRKEALHHRTVYRPWGYYDSVSSGALDQVKRITINPGKKMSLQKHERRAEHWVVVKGTARVTKGDDIITLKENESVYIPFGVLHSLENAGQGILEIIEIQTGQSFGDEDIIRIG